MITKLSREEILKMGKDFVPDLMAAVTIEQRLQGLKPEEQLRGLSPEDRIKGLSRDEIEAILNKIQND